MSKIRSGAIAVIILSLGGAAPALAQSEPVSVPMERDRDSTYRVSGLVNDKTSLDFTVDSAASDVAIPADVVDKMVRAGSLQSGDFLGNKTYMLADGSRAVSRTFRIRSLKVGSLVMENVIGSVAEANGTPLLGQSFLGRFGSWAIDNGNRTLILGGGVTSAPAETAGTSSSPATSVDPKVIELSYWGGILFSTDPADFQSYLAQYPSGSFVALAKNRLAELQKSAGLAPPPSVPPVAAAPAPPPPVQPVGASDPKPADPQAIEVAFWQSIENSQDTRDFQDYLQKYPQGSFASLAQRRRGILQKPETSPARLSQQVAVVTPPARPLGVVQIDNALTVRREAQPPTPDAFKNGIEFQCPDNGALIKMSNGKQRKRIDDDSQGNKYKCSYIDQNGKVTALYYGIFVDSVQSIVKNYDNIWPIREKNTFSFRETESGAGIGGGVSYVDISIDIRGIENVNVVAGVFPSILIEVRRREKVSLGSQGGMGSNSYNETLSRYWYCPELRMTIKHDYKIISGMYGVIGDDQEPWEATAILSP